jgi:hypothetical protein
MAGRHDENIDTPLFPLVRRRIRPAHAEPLADASATGVEARDLLTTGCIRASSWI